jgi:dihydrolipoamide dehydrogenase
MADIFDLTIIGSGPGGYVAAIRAAQLGMKVAVVEKWPTFGGTCLNIGCIPSKALLHASELFEEAGHNFATFGIDIPAPQLNLPKMMTHKDETVTANVSGVDYLFRKNKIATGSVSANLPGIEIDEEKIVSSTGALSLTEVPKNLLVIGAGVIGLELGSVWARLGAKVTVVEFLDRITPGADAELAKTLQRSLTKQGMEFRLGQKVTGAKASKSSVALTVEPVAGGAAETLEADYVLLAIGRKPYTEGLGLESVGITPDKRGFIETDHWRTSAPGVWAIGDVTLGPMLAHKAEDEAVACIETIAGRAGHVNYGVIPSVIYTWPEVAWVGKTEEELKAEGRAYKTGKFPFTANSRAKINHEAEGFVKVLADAATDEVLGVHMIGPQVSEMIGEYCVAMEFRAASEDVARTCHPHPTRSEALRQAAMGVEGWTMQA